MVNLGKLVSGVLGAAKMISGTRSRQERELRSMGTRELCDLGIGTSEIPYLLKQTDIIGGNTGDSTAAARVCRDGHGRNEQASYKQVLVLQQ